VQREIDWKNTSPPSSTSKSKSNKKSADKSSKLSHAYFQAKKGYVFFAVHCPVVFFILIYEVC
jgi:hypothetical protein